MNTFYATFGVMYSSEPHPYFRRAHPYGYLLVLAPDEDAARALLQRTISNKYAFIYAASAFRPERFELGELARLVEDGRGGVITSHADLVARFGTSDPEYYGTDKDEVVCARIEGHLSVTPNEEMYDVEYVHHTCFQAAVNLFTEVTDVDFKVLAGELDWASPYPCPVCEESIT